MGDDLVPGAALGAGVAELFRLVMREVQTVLMFKGRFKSIKDDLKYLEDPISRMTSSNDQLDIPKEELRPIHDLLKECQVLTRKCSRIWKWNFYRKNIYSKKLLDFDNRLMRFIHFNLQVIDVKDGKELRVEVAELKCQIRRMSVMQENQTSQDHQDRTIQFQNCSRVPQCPDFLVGMDIAVKNIKEKLLNGSQPVVVISGPGGYGKTTLVKKLCRDEEVKGEYQDIIFVVVSESPSLMSIVQQITHHLGGTVPDATVHTEDYAVQHLEEMLAARGKQNSILLILDDIWSGSESILKKFVFTDIPNYKVLVTSRFQFPAIGCSYLFKGLEHEDAVKLLCHAATPLIGPSTYALPNVEIIDQVVRRCKGSPLALTVVGKSLCGRDLHAWKRKLNDWSNGISLIGCNETESEILKCLKNSLKDLDGGSDESARLKQCFLDLGSFPEDCEICVAILIDMWSELHGGDWNEVDFVADIKELSARSLAELVINREDISEAGYYNDMYVTQHDLLRELAIHENSQGQIEERERLNFNIPKNNVPKWIENQKQSLKARLVSVCTDEEFCSSSWPDLDFPAAEVLVLNFKTSNNYTLPNFINKMKNLKTLIVTNNSPLPVELTNFHLITSLPTLKKIRLHRIKIPTFNTMNNLEKISVFHCDLSEEVWTTDLQINQTFPNLNEIDISYCPKLKTLPNGICKAETLTTISITHCHQLSELPEETGNLSNLQVLRLNSCTALKRLPNWIVEVENLSFLDISNCMGINKLPDGIGELCQLKELHLSGCSSLSSLPSSFRRLEHLKYTIVDKEQVQKFWRFFKNRPKLKLKVAANDTSLNFLGRGSI